MTLAFFANERFDYLELLSRYQVTVKDACYVTLNQQEIADMLHISKQKSNRIMNELIKEGYVYLYQGKKGKYALTDAAYAALKIIRAKTDCIGVINPESVSKINCPDNDTVNVV